RMTVGARGLGRPAKGSEWCLTPGCDLRGSSGWQILPRSDIVVTNCKKSGRLRSRDMTPKKEPHMRLRIWLAALLIASGVLGSRTSTPVAKARESAPDQGTSSLDDQVDLAVTIYNSDIALVRDVRELQLPRGGFDLRFMDIAATVNPATVHFRSLTEPSR